MSQPFRLTGEPDEDTLHASVAAALRLVLPPHVEWTTFPAGGYGLSKAAAGRLVRLGMARGWPDILIVHQGRIFGVELKTRNGRLSTTRIVRTPRGGPRLLIGQDEMHGRLRTAGMVIAVCRSVDDVLDQLRAWGIPTRVQQGKAA